MTPSRARIRTSTVTASKLTAGGISELNHTNRYAVMKVTKLGSVPSLTQNQQLARP
jgi:hypothetical protein